MTSGVPETTDLAKHQAAMSAELVRLASLDEKELHRIWQVRLGRNPPTHLPRSLFFRLLAYRLQAQAFGGLDRNLRARLKAAIENGENGAQRRPAALKPGSVLVREHEGELHRVMVLDEGFAWSGRTFRSLSETAYAITGTRWNGRRFFGLDHKRMASPGREAAP